MFLISASIQVFFFLFHSVMYVYKFSFLCIDITKQINNTIQQEQLWITQMAGFEPALHNGNWFQVNRLNLSATSACGQMYFTICNNWYISVRCCNRIEMSCCFAEAYNFLSVCVLVNELHTIFNVVKCMKDKNPNKNCIMSIKQKKTLLYWQSNQGLPWDSREIWK